MTSKHSKPRSIAIIGAGFAGLSIAWHLRSISQEWKVFLFDSNQHSGASRIASGLLHPFSSDFSRQVPFGRVAMFETYRLLIEASQVSSEPLFHDRIVKIPLEREQIISCSHLPRVYENLRWLSPIELDRIYPILKKPSYGLMIENGKTVFTSMYLDCLLKKVKELGVVAVNETIDIHKIAAEMDITLLCMGQSLHLFLKNYLTDEQMPIQLIKGQLLKCEIPDLKAPLTHSILAKGYLGVSPQKNVYYLGGTYEHRYQDGKPNEEVALSILKDYFYQYTREAVHLKIVDVQAGVRVAMKKDKTPKILKLSEKLFAVTGLGSKGLLYHGLLGRMMAEALYYEDSSRILDGFFSTLNIDF